MSADGKRDIPRPAPARQIGQTTHLSDNQGRFPVPISAAAV